MCFEDASASIRVEKSNFLYTIKQILALGGANLRVLLMKTFYRLVPGGGQALEALNTEKVKSFSY